MRKLNDKKKFPLKFGSETQKKKYLLGLTLWKMLAVFELIN